MVKNCETHQLISILILHLKRSHLSSSIYFLSSFFFTNFPVEQIPVIKYMEQQGRGGAMTVLTVLMAVLLLLHYCELTEAATYTVGGSGGWTFNVAGWPRGKRFRAGDALVFNYSPAAHNVVGVNKAGYSGCTTTRGAKVYRTGRDQIKLVKGQNFFICNVPGHCQSGMKLAITAV